MLCLDLIEKGLRRVQLSPPVEVYDENANEMVLMFMMMKLSRGHQESKIKGLRVGAAWANKRKLAREVGHILTKKLPGRVEYQNGRLVLNPTKAVKRVFALVAGEVDPREVFGGGAKHDEVATLTGELASVEVPVSAIMKEMDEHGESTALFKRLQVKKAAQRTLAEPVAEARQKAAKPVDQAFGEMQTLAGQSQMVQTKRG